jgi:hypothetical protein
MKQHTVTFVEEPQVAILLDNRFRLLKDFPVWVDDEWIIVPEGFETDLSSVPRVPIVFYWLGGRGHKEGILHDWMYKCNMFPREDCDDIFYWALRSERKTKAVSYAMWKGVRIGAGRVYEAYGMALQEAIDKAMITNEALQTVEVEERVWH